MVKILFDVLSWIFTLLGFIGVIGFLFEIPMVIIYAILYSKEADDAKKKKIKKWWIISCSTPPVLIILSLIAIVILNAVKVFVAK